MAVIAFGIGFSLLSILLILFAAKILISRGWFLAWLKGSVGITLISLSFFMISVTLDLFSYSQSEPQQPLATVSMSEKSPQLYSLELVDVNGEMRILEMAGDQWQLDVRVLKVGPYSSYKLDNISGRYLSLEQNDKDIQTRHALWAEGVNSLWLMVDGLVKKLPFTAETLQKVAYVPMTDGAIFQVYLSGRELNVVATNAQAKLVAPSSSL